MSKAFASQADLAEKTVSFDRLSLRPATERTRRTNVIATVNTEP